MAQPTGTFDTERAVGEREDLQDTIFNIAPTETPFMTRVAKTSGKAVFHEWQIDSLDAATKDNAQIEGDDVTGTTAVATTRIGDYMQIARKDVVISGTLDAVDKAGRNSELAYQIAKMGKALKRDMESSLTQNNEASAGGSSTARQLAGVESWLSTNWTTKGGTTGTTPGSGANNTVLTAPTDATLISDIDEAALKLMIKAAWDAGGSPELILVGSGTKQTLSTLSGIATQTYNINSPEKGAIIAGADIYVSDFGQHLVVADRFSRNRTALILDMDMWAVAQLRPLMRSPLAKTGDAEKEFMLTEFTLVSRQEAASAKVTDISN